MRIIIPVKQEVYKPYKHRRWGSVAVPESSSSSNPQSIRLSDEEEDQNCLTGAMTTLCL